MNDKDRRLILVIQGDHDDTTASFWLETPCDEHGHHVLRKNMGILGAVPEESPQKWMLNVLGAVRAEICLCDAQPSDGDSFSAILGASREA